MSDPKFYEYRTYASHRANPHPDAQTHPTRPGVLVPVEPEPTVEDYATMAANFLWSAYVQWCESEPWGLEGADIGRHDFDRIVALMGRMLPTDPHRERAHSAYKKFAARAEKVSDE